MTALSRSSGDDREAFFEKAPCAFLSMLPNGHIVQVNDTLCEWVSLSRDDLLGKSLHDLLTTPGKIFFETHFAPLLRMQGFFHEVALDLSGPDGMIIPVLANANEERDNNGAACLVRLAMFKATQRRTYERELMEARRAAEHARSELASLNASLETRIEKAVHARMELARGLLTERKAAKLREQFVAVLGHDLRNPLASIRSGLEILNRDPAPDKRQAVLELMRASTERMGALIDDMLDLAASRLGKGIAIERKPVDLRKVIDQVTAELATSHPEARIQLSMDLKGTVDCDESRIGQLLSNLVGNAISHGLEDHPIRVVADCDNESCTVRVTNAGGPIPSDVKERLFEPFSRAEVRPHQQGLGLGLFIASEIARAHKGRLDVETSEEETSFIFTMPSSAEQEAGKSL